jgi:NADH:ubiquinone oxidoreductase subunit 2 (subunit N)
MLDLPHFAMTRWIHRMLLHSITSGLGYVVVSVMTAEQTIQNHGMFHHVVVLDGLFCCYNADDRIPQPRCDAVQQHAVDPNGTSSKHKWYASLVSVLLLLQTLAGSCPTLDVVMLWGNMR